MKRYVDTERDLGRYIFQLRRLAIVLRIMGAAILAATLLHLTFAATFSVPKYSAGNDYVAGSLMAFAIVVIFAMAFEQLSSQGEIIYGEVTDELHRRQDDPALIPPQISFRIALRHFAASTNLPLIPGRFGVASYIVVNLMIVGSVLLRINPALFIR